MPDNFYSLEIPEVYAEGQLTEKDNVFTIYVKQYNCALIISPDDTDALVSDLGNFVHENDDRVVGTIYSEFLVHEI